MYGGLRQELGEVFRRLAAHRESEVEEGHLLPDHVHMMMSIPPKYSVAQVILSQGQKCDPHRSGVRGPLA